MKSPPLASLVEKIHAAQRPAVVSITGGGTAAIAELLSVPGGSQALLAAEVPYSQEALVASLGGEPDQCCSEPTARAMAMAAWMRARSLASDVEPCQLIGVGATASLVSNEPKRGDHRVYVGIQTAAKTMSLSLVMEKGARNRRQEEQLAAAMIIAALALECGVEKQSCLSSLEDLLRPGESLEQVRKVAEQAWTALLLNGSGFVRVGNAPCDPIRGIFPGAFHPLHHGHQAMAQLAEQKLGVSVCYELSITNVDKPPLDFVEIENRLAGIRHEDADRGVLLSAAPTFVAKAELWPGCTFVVGADTISRIADERYYGGQTTERDAAIEAIAQRGCRFLVFGRDVSGQFQSLADLSLPSTLHRICREVAESEFRADISSTSLRKG